VLEASERATAELARHIHGRSHMAGELTLRSGAVSHGKPADDKRDLETQHCDRAVREPFIAALAMQRGGV
jgi:hypothetical protein